MIGGLTLALVVGEGLWKSRDFNPANLRTVRKQAAKEVEAFHASIARSTELSVAGMARWDRCIKGRHDIKNQDTYDHKCTLKATHYYGFSGDFRQRMSDLGRWLLVSGWRSPGSSIEYMMSEYYDGYYGRPDPRNSEQTYLVDSLPMVSYQKDDFVLSLIFSERGTTNHLLLNNIQALEGETTMGVKEEIVDVYDLHNRVMRDHQFMVAISIEIEYYEV